MSFLRAEVQEPELVFSLAPEISALATGTNCIANSCHTTGNAAGSGIRDTCQFLRHGPELSRDLGVTRGWYGLDNHGMTFVLLAPRPGRSTRRGQRRGSPVSSVRRLTLGNLQSGVIVALA